MVLYYDIALRCYITCLYPSLQCSNDNYNNLIKITLCKLHSYMVAFPFSAVSVVKKLLKENPAPNRKQESVSANVSKLDNFTAQKMQMLQL